MRKLIIKETDVILNRVKDYYKNDKERLRDNSRDKYRNLSEEEKNVKREYGRNRDNDMSEQKKQRLKEYQKIILRLKSLNLVIDIFYGVNSVCYDLGIYYEIHKIYII